MLGAITKGTDTLVTSSFSSVATAFGVVWGNYDEATLRSKFNELDVDGSGTLDRKEVAKALRDTNHSEAEIQKTVGKLWPEHLKL